MDELKPIPTSPRSFCCSVSGDESPAYLKKPTPRGQARERERKNQETKISGLAGVAQGGRWAARLAALRPVR
jgi:hypothetical protein